MNAILSALGIIFAVFLSSVNADFCVSSGQPIYCGNCCCFDSDDNLYCCSCNLAWWAILLIVIGVISIIAVAIACGVWRRRVYLRRTTTIVYNPLPGTQHVVTTGTSYGTTTTTTY